MHLIGIWILKIRSQWEVNLNIQTDTKRYSCRLGKDSKWVGIINKENKQINRSGIAKKPNIYRMHKIKTNIFYDWYNNICLLTG